MLRKYRTIRLNTFTNYKDKLSWLIYRHCGTTAVSIFSRYAMKKKKIVDICKKYLILISVILKFNVSVQLLYPRKNNRCIWDYWLFNSSDDVFAFVCACPRLVAQGRQYGSLCADLLLCVWSSVYASSLIVCYIHSRIFPSLNVMIGDDVIYFLI